MPEKKPKNFKPVKNYPKGHRHYGKPRCQAWAYGPGRQCLALAWAKHGLDKCRVHGATSKKGIEHPNLDSGIHSKYLTIDLREKYKQRVNDPELLRVSDDIALLDARIFEQLESLGSGGGAAVFVGLQKEFKLFERANNRAQALGADNPKRLEHMADARDHLAEVRRLVNYGVSRVAIWNDIDGLMERKRRLIETEQKLLVNMQLLISVEKASYLVDMLLQSVRRNVTEPAALHAIQSDFNQYTTGANQ